MKNIIYLSAATLLVLIPGIAKAQSSSDLTPGEIFCSKTNANSGNAIIEVNRILDSRSARLSREERQALEQMTEILDNGDTVQSVCSPAEF